MLAELDTSAFERRGTIGGGEWSAKDLAAHLGAWEGSCSRCSRRSARASGRRSRTSSSSRARPTGSTLAEGGDISTR